MTAWKIYLIKEVKSVVEQLIDLDKEIDEALKLMPDFYTRYIERSQLLSKYDTANEIFSYATYKLFTEHRMKEYTSYQFNALALRYFELKEASATKKELEKKARYNDQLIQLLKSVNEIYNKCKTEVEDLKKLLKINDLPRLEYYE